VTEQVKIDPRGVTASLLAAKDTTVERPRSVEVSHWESEVKVRSHRRQELGFGLTGSMSASILR
jgi:hypothetical protein